MPAGTVSLTGTAWDADRVSHNPGSAAAAFESLVLEHYDAERASLERYLAFLGVDPDSCRDIVHDVFLKLHEHLLHGGAVTNLRAWLYRVAHNLAQNRRSAAFVRKRASLPEDGAAHPPAPEESPEQAVLAVERDSRLRLALENLSAVQRECLVLRSQGLKYREIAEVQKLSVSSVAEAVQRAVQQLRRVLS